MIVGPRALEALEVLGQGVLGEERRPIHAREHRPAGVTAPVGAGDGLELERLDALGARGVRAAAEVGERPVGVERDGVQRVGGICIPEEILDQLDLVVLTLVAEARERLTDRDLLAGEDLIGLDVLAHARLDGLEVSLGEADTRREIEVVVETAGNRGADRDLDPGIELHDRGGEHVGGIVADEPEGVIAAALGEDLDLAGRPVGRRGTVPERAGQVADLAVELDGQRGPSETRADRGGDIGAGGVVGDAQALAVGKLEFHRRRMLIRRRAAAPRPGPGRPSLACAVPVRGRRYPTRKRKDPTRWARTTYIGQARAGPGTGPHTGVRTSVTVPW